MSTSNAVTEKRLSIKRPSIVSRLLHRQEEDLLSDALDKQNKQDFLAHQSKYQFKVLLLGAGDSGKTTLLKQLKILHGHGFDKKEIQQWADRIQQNMTTAIAAIITLAKKEGALKAEEDKVSA
jgi:hypothetical protein